MFHQDGCNEKEKGYRYTNLADGSSIIPDTRYMTNSNTNGTRQKQGENPAAIPLKYWLVG
jgi:hypothetical protein